MGEALQGLQGKGKASFTWTRPTQGGRVRFRFHTPALGLLSRLATQSRAKPYQMILHRLMTKYLMSLLVKLLWLGTSSLDLCNVVLYKYLSWLCNNRTRFRLLTLMLGWTVRLLRRGSDNTRIIYTRRWPFLRRSSRIPDNVGPTDLKIIILTSHDFLFSADYYFLPQ